MLHKFWGMILKGENLILQYLLSDIEFMPLRCMLPVLNLSLSLEELIYCFHLPFFLKYSNQYTLRWATVWEKVLRLKMKSHTDDE